ncbi:MAG: hypothetical protein ACE5H5_03300 [Nitrospinota bacterium]
MSKETERASEPGSSSQLIGTSGIIFAGAVGEVAERREASSGVSIDTVAIPA